MKYAAIAILFALSACATASSPSEPRPILVCPGGVEATFDSQDRVQQNNCVVAYQ